MNKKQIRKEIQHRKADLSGEQIKNASHQVFLKLMETKEFREAKSLYVYMAYNQEIQTAEIVKEAWRLGKRVAVPKLFGKEMHFIEINSFDELIPDRFGIPTPIRDEPFAQTEDALMIVPGLAFDLKGNRMGYGGGFYDRYLEKHPHHYTIALCYSFQIIEHLEAESHDIPVHKILIAEEKAV